MTILKKTLTGTLVIVMTSWMKQDDPALLQQLDGNLEDADASASQVYASANRRFQEARELLSRVKSFRGYFPVVGIGAFDTTDRQSAKCLVAKATRARGKGKSSSQKGGKVDKPGYTWLLAKTTDLTF